MMQGVHTMKDARALKKFYDATWQPPIRVPLPRRKYRALHSDTQAKIERLESQGLGVTVLESREGVEIYAR